MSLCKECQYCKLLHGSVFEEDYVWNCKATHRISLTLKELYEQCPWNRWVPYEN